MNKMGGLRKFMPITSTAFIIGALAISGIPPLVGFFAKDPIIGFADQTGHTIMWILAVGAAFLSALYISRLIFITFFGSYRGTEHPHESPKVMTIPMMVLSALAIFGGVLGLSSTTGAIETFLQPVTGQLPKATQGLPDYTLTVIGITAALAGIAVGWFVYGSGRIDWLALRSRYLPLHRFLEHGWYIDDAYATIIGAPATVGAAFLAYVVDSRWIDGFFNNVGRWTLSLAAVGRRVQTGLVRTYALVFLIGAFGVIFYLVAVR
jgi:NADH-quinone oxidoreductase subunit L